MKVSVIIAGYRQEFIGETLQSIFDQTVKAHEIIYIQDLGHCAHKINRMADMVTGDAIINLGDDDKLSPDYIEKTVQAMVDNNVDMVYTDIQLIGDQTGIMPAMDYTNFSFRVSNPTFVTNIVKKEAWKRAGGWDQDIRYADWDFNWRLFKTGATAFHLKEPLFKYRIHGGMDTASVDVKEARENIKNKHPEIII